MSKVLTGRHQKGSVAIFYAMMAAALAMGVLTGMKTVGATMVAHMHPTTISY